MAQLSRNPITMGYTVNTFHLAIARIKSQPTSTAKLAFRVLEWLIQAGCELTVKEMQVAVSVKQNQYYLNERDMPDKATLLKICAGLIVVDHTTNIIKPVDPKVLKYLIQYSYCLKDKDFYLAMVCTTYLSFDTFAQGACTTYDSFKSRLELHPFLRYAATYLRNHVKYFHQAHSTDIILKFLRRPGCIESYIQARNPFFYQPDFTQKNYDKYLKGRHPIHMAVHLGHPTALQVLLNQEGDHSAQCNEGPTVHLVAFFGAKEIAQSSLGEGPDSSIWDSGGRTPLHTAAVAGRADLVRLLTEKGADLNILHSHDESTPLHTTAKEGGEKPVQLLLEAKASTPTQDNREQTAPDLVMQQLKRNAAAMLQEAKSTQMLTSRKRRKRG